MTRAAINAFELANPLYKNATVSFYTVASGVKTSTLATLYSGTTGVAQLSNPQKLNSRGQFKQPVYIEDPVIGVVAGISVPGHDTGIITPAPTFQFTSAGLLQYSFDSGVTWFDAGTLAATTVASLVTFLQAGTGAVSITMQDKGRQQINIEDFGASPSASAAVNTAAIHAARDHVYNTYGGGTIHAGHGTFDVSEVLLNKQFVVLEGESGGPGYNAYTYGTAFNCTSGVFAFCIPNGAGIHGTGLRNCSVKSTGVDATNVEYGVVICNPVSIMDNVGVQGFKRNISGMGFDKNTFRDVTTVFATQTGFELLNGLDAPLQHPNLNAALVGSATGSTIWCADNLTIRRNYVGAVLTDGVIAAFNNVVCESNYHHGLVLYGGLNSRPYMYDFSTWHFEGNFSGWAGANAALYSLADYNGNGDPVLACLSSAGHILEGTSSGDWASTASQTTTDAGYHVWTGSKVETDPIADPAAAAIPEWITFSNISSSSPYSIKIRSGYRIRLKNWYATTGHGGIAPSYSPKLGTYSYDTLIDGGWGSSDAWLKASGGTRTKWFNQGIDSYVPTLTCGTSGTITTNGESFYVLREGNRITVSGRVTVASVSSPVGALRVSIPAPTAYAEAAVCVQADGLTGVANSGITGRLTTSALYMTLSYFDGNNQAAMAAKVQAASAFVITVTYLVR